MRTIKATLLTAALALLAAGCYNDDALIERLDKQDSEISQMQTDIAALRGEISKINSNIQALQTTLNALKGNIYVSSVEDVLAPDGSKAGYTISFTDGKTVTIYNGADGKDGANGEDGHTPVIGVKESGGVYYWTLDGEWLTVNGQPVRATGEKGADGLNGQDGKTPQLRINEDNWEVSFDGETWEVVGPATSTVSGGDSIFKSVKETKSDVIFTLVDGTKIYIPLDVDFTIKVDDSKSYDVTAGATTEIPYTLVGADSETKVDAIAGGLWWAEVEKTDNESGVVKVTAPEEGADKGKVLLYAATGKGKSDIRTLNFEGGVLTVTAPAAEVPAKGAVVEIPVVTNVDYTVSIDEESETWVSYVVTKAGAMRNETIELTVSENTTPEQRIATIALLDAQGATIKTMSVTQESGTYVEPVFEDSSFKSYLLWTKGLDYNEDGHISASEAARCTSLDLYAPSYTSLAGIEALYNLKTFSYTEGSSSKVTAIDLSKNKKLESVTIAKSWGVTGVMADLNISDLPALKTVQLGNSAVETLALGSAPRLESLSAYNTKISSYKLEGAPALKSLAVYGSPITTLDISANTKLETLTAGCKNLASLDLKANTALKSLNIDDAAITALDLSGLTALESFSYDNAKVETIDLAGSPKLTSFSVGRTNGTSSTLKVVDLRNATGLKSVTIYSNALREVIVPKGTSTASWNWNSYLMDPDTGEVTYVTLTEVEVEGGSEVSDYAEGIQDAFVKKQILGKFDTDGDGQISAAEAAAVTEIDLDECGLSDGDLNGLEAFPVEKLIISNNKFKSFDVSKFEKLTWLNANNNALTTLTIPTSMLHVEAAHNQIETVSVPSYSAKAQYVDLSYNKLKAFSMQYASGLKYADLSHNSLSSFSVYGAYGIETIDASHNALTGSQNLSSFSSLKTADFADNQLTGVSLGSATKLESVDLSNNKFTQLDITSAIKSTTLRLIDLTGNSDFNLLIIGAGNTLPETLEIRGVEGYNVLNASNPTYAITNQYGNIASLDAGDKADFSDITLNFSIASSGFKIEDGGNAVITAKAGKKVLAFYAVATSGSPEIQLERSSDNPIYTKDTDSSAYGDSYKASGVLPLKPEMNESAAKDWKNFIEDGNGHRVTYHLAKQWTSAGSTADGETITIKVTGGTAVVFGINLSGSRVDDE